MATMDFTTKPLALVTVDVLSNVLQFVYDSRFTFSRYPGSWAGSVPGGF